MIAVTSLNILSNSDFRLSASPPSSPTCAPARHALPPPFRQDAEEFLRAAEKFLRDAAS